MSVGIIGYGFVGKAVAQLRKAHDVYIYDPNVSEFDSEDSKKEAYGSDVVFVCVPTPSGKDGALDISIVAQVVAIWAELRSEDSVLAIKSTIPPGTTDALCQEYGVTKVVHNPEFLSERTALEDFANAKEIIVGGDQDACEKVIDVYRHFYSDPNPMVRTYKRTAAKTAEMVKMVRNSYYATKIMFMNEVFDYCQISGVDFNIFRDMFTDNGKHPWIARQHTLVPGPDGKIGFGGHCLPKDSVGLIQAAKVAGGDLSVLQAAVIKNQSLRNEEV